MKLRNKKTGEIMDDVQYRNYILSDGFGFRMNGKEWEYHSLAELNEEWEDYEEPKEYFYIYADGDIYKDIKDDARKDNGCKEIGNYFDTRKGAERAVEKLKAWKQLKDKGVKFDIPSFAYDESIAIFARFPDRKTFKETNGDICKIFGGEG